jgi:hypothetical protein
MTDAVRRWREKHLCCIEELKNTYHGKSTFNNVNGRKADTNGDLRTQMAICVTRFEESKAARASQTKLGKRAVVVD